ncbi:putative Nuclear receptor coactivator 2 (NCoA-2) (Transcriptional intermediary factor 2) (XTIF2), partial [Fasciola gigantica]
VPGRVEDNLPGPTESHFRSGEEALSHLDGVINFVVSEAIDYAEKPPEERTLPKLTRKAPPPPRIRNSSMVMGNLAQMHPDAANDLNRMTVLGGNTQFQQKLQNQLPTMVPFGANQAQQQHQAQQQQKAQQQQSQVCNQRAWTNATAEQIQAAQNQQQLAAVAAAFNPGAVVHPQSQPTQQQYL